MSTTSPDIFTNVHKGIRKALFEACIALGRAGDDERRGARARGLLRDALHFTAHHGENEDVLLLPLLELHAPAVFERLRDAHAGIDASLGLLIAAVEDAPTQELYQRTCEFTGRYLEHMHEEEQRLEPLVRAALSEEQLLGFGRGSVERTAPADQQMMLTWMLPAMTRADVDVFLARLPSEVAERLRPIADAAE